ncbi:hypothetical protein [Flindersiella endophytica]
MDQPLETKASAGDSARKGRWLDLENEPTEKLLAFLGLDRTEDISDNDLG